MIKPECHSVCEKYYGWISLGNGAFNAALKLAVGTMANSRALVADGFLSLVDVITSLLSLISLRISRWPKNENHPYGYGKVEFLMSALFGCVLLTVASFTIFRSVSAMAKSNLAPPMLAAVGPAVISILCNLAMNRYGSCVNRCVNSPSIAANAKENLADALSSTATLAGIVGALAGCPILDPIAAVLVALMIAFIGVRVLGDATNGLLDGSAGADEIRRMRRHAASLPGVERVASLKTRRIGQSLWIDARIVVQGGMALSEADRIAREVRNSIMRNFRRVQDATVYLDCPPSSQSPEPRPWRAAGWLARALRWPACATASFLPGNKDAR